MLRPYQIDALDQIRKHFGSGIKRVLLHMATGAGKCHARGTPILMHDGSIKKVEDVVAGDLLMGPDSKPRRVRSTCRGSEKMYNVMPVKGEPWGCNESHILSLVHTETGDIVNISVSDYLKQHDTFKHCHKLYRVGVEFQESPVSFDSYVVGIYLAEGTRGSPQITNPDPEILEYIRHWADNNSMHIRDENGSGCREYHFRAVKMGWNANHADRLRKALNVGDEKRIPQIYLINSREVRMQVLAGLIDGDGYLHHSNFEIITKWEGLRDDILFLARSLGFAAYSKMKTAGIKSLGFVGIYHRIIISGHTNEIPTKVERKKAEPRRQIKNVLRTGFELTCMGIDDYFGFDIDGDHLYLLGDFTVTHNTVCFSEILKGVSVKGKRAIMVVRGKDLVDNASRRLFHEKVDHGCLQANHWNKKPSAPIQVCSVDTLYRRKIAPPADLVVLDECFTGDVEILTSKGFMRFDNPKLNEQKVAQFNIENNEISFCTPIRFIEKDVVDQDMVSFLSDRKIDLTVTASHEMVLERKDGSRVKKKASKVKCGWNYMVKAGMATGQDDILTPNEKMEIVFQADGHHQSTHREYFTFKKERKITAFLELLNEGNFLWNEVSNNREKKRYSVYGLNVSKRLAEWFDLTTMSAKKCRAIIEYMVNWDGSRVSDSLYYYSSTIKENTDFIQAVATLAGYYSFATVQIDDRSDKFNNVHRIFINKKSARSSFQDVEISKSKFTGKVYCATVPDGNIIVRRNGKVVICGNCHFAGSDSFKWLVDQYPDAFFLPVSATPHVKDGLRHIADVVVYPITVNELIQQGYLSKPIYFAPSDPDLSGVEIDSKTGDFKTGQLSNAMAKSRITGDIIEQYRKHCHDFPAVLFAVNIEHSLALMEQLNQHGIKAEHVEANTPTIQREAVLRRLESGDTKIVCNVGILTTGVDMPYLRAVIMARPTMSYNLHIQVLGRGTRIYPGKSTFTVLDHAGNLERHGFIEAERLCNLDGVKKKEKSESDIRYLRCPNCYAYFESTSTECPQCGFDCTPQRNSQIKVVEGNLQMITDEQIQKEIKRNEIIREARKKLDRNPSGNYQGWAFHRIREELGEAYAKKSWRDIKREVPRLQAGA